MLALSHVIPRRWTTRDWKTQGGPEAISIAPRNSRHPSTHLPIRLAIARVA